MSHHFSSLQWAMLHLCSQQWATTSPAMSHHLSSNESPPLQQWVITSPAFTGTRVFYETFACFEQSLVPCTVFDVVEFHKHFPMDLWWAVLQGRQILKNIRNLNVRLGGQFQDRGSKMRVQKGASKEIWFIKWYIWEIYWGLKNFPILLNLSSRLTHRYI